MTESKRQLLTLKEEMKNEDEVIQCSFVDKEALEI